MQIINNSVIYSVSDLLNDLECEHLTTLERSVAMGALQAPDASSSKQLIQRKAEEHEQRYLDRLRAQYGETSVVEFATSPTDSRSIDALREADAATHAAMASGARAIYQPTFFDGTFTGRADFLRRIDTRSAAWPWSYELVDTKLALSVKAHFPLQLAHYDAQVTRLQGSESEFGYVALGSGVERRFRIHDYAAYYRHRRSKFFNRMLDKRDTYPAETAHCGICRWSVKCDAQRDADDHLSLVANIRNDQIGKLQNIGITRLTELAAADATTRPKNISVETFSKLRAQAMLQHQQRVASASSSYPYRYELLAPIASEGFAQLPAPNEGDLFFDIEGDPLYAADHGLEYLWGFTHAVDRMYRAFWALNDSEEKATFEAVLDFIVERRRQYPGMHIYHYAPYEISAIRRLSCRYATREEEVDQLLRSQAFVDLYAVVRQSLRISQPSYSIKKLEPFYGMARNTDVRRGDDSIVQFEEWLASGDQSILEDIERYNDDDCRSTLLLRDWLLERKAEAERHYNIEIPWRPQPELKAPSELAAAHHELTAALLTGVNAPTSLSEFRAFPKKRVLDGCSHISWTITAATKNRSGGSFMSAAIILMISLTAITRH